MLLLINNSVGISHCNCQPCSYNNSKNFGLCINVTCFQKQPPLFRLKVSQIPQENTCVGVSFFPWNDEIIKRYLFCMSKGRCPFSECELCKWRNLLGIFFFQSTFEANKMFCLLGKFVIFMKQPLKYVQQNSYQDFWSYTLYIIWQGVHPLVK